MGVVELHLVSACNISCYKKSEAALWPEDSAETRSEKPLCWGCFIFLILPVSKP